MGIFIIMVDLTHPPATLTTAPCPRPLVPILLSSIFQVVVKAAAAAAAVVAAAA